MARRKSFDEGHGNPEYTVKKHPAFDVEHGLWGTDYGRRVRYLVESGNDLEKADAHTIVDMGDRNPFDTDADTDTDASYHAYAGYIDNAHDIASTDPSGILGESPMHPHSIEDVNRLSDSVHYGAMSNVESYKDDYGTY